MISDDEYLERIVAGIQSVTMSEAKVNWNEIINGRQFDVVVRFRAGTLKFLVLVEVRNRKRKASASDLEAFVQKAKDQKANKAVFVNRAGFQSGAIAIAKRHGTDLFTVRFDEDQVSFPSQGTYLTFSNKSEPIEPPKITIGDPIPILIYEKVTLLYKDGSSFRVPYEPSQMSYYFRKTKLSNGKPLVDLLPRFDITDLKLNYTETKTVRIKPPQKIRPPDSYFFPAGRISSMKIQIAVRERSEISGNIALDPNIFSSPIIYTNAITGDEQVFETHSLPIGVDKVVEGKFYFSYNPLSYFYCESIEKDIVKWHIVESFQNDELFRASMRINILHSNKYMLVTSKETIARLKNRWRQMQRI